MNDITTVRPIAALADGGPAFPVTRLERNPIFDGMDSSSMPFVVHAEYPGMSLRDYFAAHAPAQPWPWFQPSMPPKPDETWSDFHTSGQCGDFCECLPENYQARHAWNEERNRQQVIQWPYGYADAMLAERERF